MEDQVSKMLISVGDSQSWNVLLALLMIAMITLEHFYKGDKTS